MLKMNVVQIDTRRITDWNGFHDVFDEAFGFPEFYGRNLNAWIDCMTSLDAPEDGMTRVHTQPGGMITIQLESVDSFISGYPEIYAGLIESLAFVNWRRIERGSTAILAVSFARVSRVKPNEKKRK